jgi:hypothetical protein
MRSSPPITAPKRKFPHHTQYVAHGRDHGIDTLEGINPNPVGVDVDADQGTP